MILTVINVRLHLFRLALVIIGAAAIAAGCNNGNEYHIHHGKTGVLLETLSEMLAVLLSNTDKPKVIECLFIDAMHESLLDKLRDKQKKNPLE